MLHEEEKSFQGRFPENPELPPMGGEGYGQRGYPKVVVALIREWVEALRCAARHVQKCHAVELTALVEVADRNWRGACEAKKQEGLSRLWSVRALSPLILAALLAALRFCLKRGLAR